MAQITSREELEAWLKDKPADWGQVIAARAALRVLPIVFRPISKDYSSNYQWYSGVAQASVRAAYVLWAINFVPENDTNQEVKLVANAIYRYAEGYIPVDWSRDNFGISDDAAAEAACHAIYSALISDLPEAVEAAADASYAACGMVSELNGHSIIWESVNDDAAWLLDQKIFPFSAFRLIAKPLWLFEPIEWPFYASVRRLLTLDPAYQVWIDWYNHRIRGERAAFAIPGDSDRTEDKKIFARLADATNEDFWDKGATYVNTTLQSWIDEARERVAPSKLTKAEVQVAVVKYASPDARIVDDQFDAGPNAIFDKPRYDGDLATLPSQLRAFIGALLGSLPRNAPDVIRHCLSAYNDELLARGTQPIVSIVKGMASAIAAQVWISPDEADKDDPDAWVLKDPREWEAGTADLFRTFFKAHLDLITHFPLDPEREAMLAATPIDEVAASDKALTDPIDKVTDLIITLAKDGHATDNIVRIVKALADYTRDIAGMPKSDEAGLPSTTITPKRRHVLQTAGFYLHAYSILGTTASLAPLPQVQALMTALADAAERLMAFII